MKSAIGRCVAFGLMITSGLSAFAAPEAGIRWQTDLEQAIAVAQRENKPLLIQFTASWCGHCDRMKRETFSDSGVVITVNNCFVPVMLDADQNPELMESLGVAGLPTTVVVMLQTRQSEHFRGFRTVAQIQEDLSPFCAREQDQPEGTATVPATSAPEFAFDRVCLVTLMDERKIQVGDAQFSLKYHDRTICFASADHLRRFLANPELYWPLNEGRCPVTAVESGETVDGHPETAMIYQGRLVLLENPARQQKFALSPATYVSERQSPEINTGELR